MDIKYAILGMLSWRPLTGYDLKKLFADSEILYWSGNNNQIYTTLVQLRKVGLVTQEVEQPETGPARKVYSLTEAGRAALREQARSVPELPQVRSPFLIQLAWSDVLAPDELDELLAHYAEELRVKLLMLEEHAQRGGVVPDRTPREALLWRAIRDRWAAVFANELAWVRGLREELRRF